jgi:hypothetical protein
MGQSGAFRERTVIAPDFDLIEKEVENCSDVVLNIGFWVWTGASWERENYTYPYPNTGINGHTITVAGVNSTTLRIAISDPAFDAFENGLITYGRTPVPHVHPGPEPPYTTHNNASLVSQDIYSVSWINPPLPPCPGGNWTIVGYGNIPGVYAVIESAVITSPIGVHDVAVTNVKPWKSVVFQSRPPNDIYKCPINVTVADEGNFPEVFNVTLYVNNTSTNITSVAFQTLTLTSGKSKTVTLNWTTTGFAKFNYTVKAAADIVDGETHVADNNLTDGGVFVSMIGDLTNYLLWPFVPDGKSDGSDLIVCSRCYGSNPTSPPPLKWDPNCDITNDGKIDGSDLIIVAHAYGTKDP